MSPKKINYQILLPFALFLLVFVSLLFFGRLFDDVPYELKLLHKFESLFSPGSASYKGETFQLPKGCFYDGVKDRDNNITQLGCTAGPFKFLSIYCIDRDKTNIDLIKLLKGLDRNVIRGTILSKSFVFVSGSDTLYITRTLGNTKKQLWYSIKPYYTTICIPSRSIFLDYTGIGYDLDDCFNDLKIILYKDSNRVIEYSAELSNELNR